MSGGYITTSSVFKVRQIRNRYLLVGGFNPSEKYVRQIGSFPYFPNFGDENNTGRSLKPPPSLTVVFSAEKYRKIRGTGFIACFHFLVALHCSAELLAGRPFRNGAGRPTGMRIIDSKGPWKEGAMLVANNHIFYGVHPQVNSLYMFISEFGMETITSSYIHDALSRLSIHIIDVDNETQLNMTNILGNY